MAVTTDLDQLRDLHTRGLLHQYLAIEALAAADALVPLVPPGPLVDAYAAKREELRKAAMERVIG